MTILPIIAVALLGALWLSSMGLVLAALFSIPFLGWRYDNDSGTYFVLGILFLFILAVPAMLLALLAMLR